MADQAISMLRDAAETPSVFLSNAGSALSLLSAAIEAEKAISGIGQFEPEFREGADEVSALWDEALALIDKAASSVGVSQDEDRLRVVLGRMAALLKGSETSDSDPVIWLLVHDMEKSVRTGEASHAVALMDSAMFLLAEYLDLTGVIDIEDRV